MQSNKEMKDEEVLALIKGVVLSLMADYIGEYIGEDELSFETENILQKLAEELGPTLNSISVTYANISKEEQVKKFLYLIETVEEWYLQSKDLEE